MFFDQTMNYQGVLCCFLLTFFFSATLAENETDTREIQKKSDEARLIEDLLRTYKDRGAGLARPVADSTQRLEIDSKFIIHGYSGITDVTKIMKMSGLLKMTWKDDYLGSFLFFFLSIVKRFYSKILKQLGTLLITAVSK